MTLTRYFTFCAWCRQRFFSGIAMKSLMRCSRFPRRQTSKGVFCSVNCWVSECQSSSKWALRLWIWFSLWIVRLMSLCPVSKIHLYFRNFATLQCEIFDHDENASVLSLIVDFTFFTLFLLSLDAFSERSCTDWQFVILSNHRRFGYLFADIVGLMYSMWLHGIQFDKWQVVWLFNISSDILSRDMIHVRKSTWVPKYFQKYSNEARTSNLYEKSISTVSRYKNIEDFEKYIDKIIPTLVACFVYLKCSLC